MVALRCLNGAFKLMAGERTSQVRERLK